LSKNAVLPRLGNRTSISDLKKKKDPDAIPKPQSGFGPPGEIEGGVLWGDQEKRAKRRQERRSASCYKSHGRA